MVLGLLGAATVGAEEEADEVLEGAPGALYWAAERVARARTAADLTNIV